jgi:hypothetical protein
MPTRVTPLIGLQPSLQALPSQPKPLQTLNLSPVLIQAASADISTRFFLSFASSPSISYLTLRNRQISLFVAELIPLVFFLVTLLSAGGVFKVNAKLMKAFFCRNRRSLHTHMKKKHPDVTHSPDSDSIVKELSSLIHQ